ncbi:hypothetical protein GGI15_004621 [Coemansia interrupta]|uniref:Chitin-binding type-4 domain-containing protein n=1 Tax=Coemansia interrupta TaxID=1126814 RepID=A0A9W8LEZ5_9FUNG|nr:hypothetical protein GGI15_004621 [Coemansia interrupta]
MLAKYGIFALLACVVLAQDAPAVDDASISATVVESTSVEVTVEASVDDSSVADASVDESSEAASDDSSDAVALDESSEAPAADESSEAAAADSSADDSSDAAADDSSAEATEAPAFVIRGASLHKRGYYVSVAPSSEAPAYGGGAVEPSSEQPAYGGGAVEPSSEAPAYGGGAVEPSSEQPAYGGGAVDPLLSSPRMVAVPSSPLLSSPLTVAVPSSPLLSSLPMVYAVPFATPSAEWKAGQSVTVAFQNDGAAHGGGHCQFSVSYDGGNTFVVVYEVLQYCFFGVESTSNAAAVLSYTFDLPKDLPSSDTAVFAWTWVNAISGSPEFYMNCADVKITGSSSSYTGKEIVIANYKDYPTIWMQGDHSYGLEYYENAKTITVTGNGKTTTNGSTSNVVKDNNVGVSAKNSSSKTDSSETGSEDNNDEIVTPVYLDDSSDDDSSSKTASSSLSSSLSSETGTSTTTTTTKTSRSTSKAASATSSAIGAVAPAANVGSGSCASGEMRCGADPSNFDTCDNNVWVSRPCAAGTSCQEAYVDINPCMP